MIRLKKILLPTDFSQNARSAQNYACAFADQFDAELHVLYVLQDLTLVMPEPGAMFAIPALNVAEVEQSAQRMLLTVPDDSWAKGKKVIRATRTGSPYVEIVRYAADAGIDLIVMSTHGRSGLPHVLLGSVAEKVVRKAGCPVLTVRPGEHQFVTPAK
ncbi:MAG: universal stress protein [Planctomycetota bacterium]|nr:universal stress protein [Planctomycetota bacterium]